MNAASTTIAGYHYRQIVRHPVFFLLVGVFSFLIVFCLYLPLFTLSKGQDVMVIMEMGLSSLVLCGFFIAGILIPLNIQDEVESRAHLTILSKPVSKWSLLAGRFMGLELALMDAAIVLGFVLYVTIWLKRGHLDVRHWLLMLSAGAMACMVIRKLWPMWSLAIPSGMVVSIVFGIVFLQPEARQTAMLLAKGGYLSLLQLTMLAAVIVPMASFLRPVPSLFLLGGIFLLGHLAPYLRHAAREINQVFHIAVEGIYVFIPHLANYNVGPVVALGKPIPLAQMGYATLHTTAYTLGLLLMGGALFECRDA